MTEPDDRELESYLKGDSELSRRYREASRETPPPALDEAVLARARAETRRRPRASPWLASLALAASLLLGVNLAWNLYEAQPVPLATADRATEPVPAPRGAPPPAAPERDALAQERKQLAQQEKVLAAAQAKEEARREREVAALRRAEPRPRAESAAPAAAQADAAPAPWSEREKIDRLIQFVAGLDDVDFIRNGKEYPAEEAAKHMRRKLDAAGERVRTADDFIRLCASFSSQTGAAYLIRFADGRTRTAEDVLREQLATMP